MGRKVIGGIREEYYSSGAILEFGSGDDDNEGEEENWGVMTKVSGRMEMRMGMILRACARPSAK